MVFARTVSSVQILICGGRGRGDLLIKRSPLQPLPKAFEKWGFTDGMCVQILICRALCLRELVGRDVKGLFAILSANRVRFVVDSAAIRDQCPVRSNFDLSVGLIC